MHIFQVIPNLREGGAERFVVDLCNVLVEDYRCRVTLIVFYFNKKNLLFRDLNHDVKVVNLKKRSGFDLSIFWKLFKLARKFNPDVIHTHLTTLNYMLVNSICFNNKIKFIHTIHSSPEINYRNQKKIIKIIDNLLYGFAGVKPVVISTDSLTEFKRLFKDIQPVLIFNGRPKVNVSQKYSVVIKEIESLKKSPGTKVFINLARISAVKNQLMLVDAFNKLINEGKDIILLIVGTWWENEIVNKIKCRISESIYLLGFKDNPIDYLACSNAFCLTSFHEGMPISLIESIQLGVIPICTPAGGVKDIISSSIGFISKDFTSLSYVESIKSFLALNEQDIEKRRTYGMKKYEECYTMKISASKYLKIYND